MKLCSIIILASELLLISCSPNMKVKNDLKEYGLKGKVKTMGEVEYMANTKFGEIVKGERKRNNRFTSDRFIIFNVDGNTLEEHLITSDGIIETKIYTKYDNYGKKTETIYYTPDDQIRNKNEYKYDARGNIIEENYYDSNGKLEHKSNSEFDNGGNEIKYQSYDSEGNLIDSVIFDYDDSGNCIKSTTYDHEGNFSSFLESEFDDEGNVIEQKKFYSVVNWFKLSNTYNNNKDLLGTKTWSRFDLILEQRYEYAYDKKNNWIKKIYYEDGKLKSLTERKIEYYD